MKIRALVRTVTAGALLLCVRACARVRVLRVCKEQEEEKEVQFRQEEVSPE